MKKVFILLLLLWNTQFGYSQSGCRLSIRGEILNQKDSAAIPMAEIFIESGHIHAKSNINGTFNISNLCSGTILLEIDKSGYIHKHLEFSIARDTFLTIYLQAGSDIQDTITIHAQVEKSKELAVDRSAIINSNGEDLSKILAGIPGIQILQGGRNQAKPMVRGMYGLRVPIISGQFKLEGQQWGNDHNPEADAQSFDQIELIKDASALKLSHEGFGGVIRILHLPTPHDGESNLDQGFQYGSNGNQWAYTAKYTGKDAPDKPITYANISARKAGNYRTPDILLDNTGLEEYAGGFGFIKEKNRRKEHFDIGFYRFEGGILPATRAGNINDLAAAINRKVPLSSDKFNYRIGAPRQVAGHVNTQYERNISLQNGNYTWSASLQYDQRREFDFHRSSQLSFPQLDLILIAPGFQLSRTWYRPSNSYFTIGNILQAQLNRFGGFYFLPDFQSIGNGTYALWHFHHRKVAHTFVFRGDGKWMNASVRENGQFKTQNRYFANYSAAYSGQVTKGRQQFQWHISRMWRAPWFNELYTSGVHHGSASYEKGNADLTTEKSYRLEAEWQYSNKYLTVYISPYFNLIYGFINLTPDNSPVVTVRGVFPGYTYKQGDAFFAAADASIQLQISKALEFKSKGSFIYAQYTADGKFPAFIPQSRIQNSAIIHQGSWGFQIDYEAVFRQLYYEKGSDLLPPPSGYALLGCGITNKSLDRKSRLEISLSASNIMNTRYRSYTDRLRYFSDMPGRNIMLRLIWHIHHHHTEHYNQNKIS